jgi:post-segregation antitoxin (ccd killing protein)
MFCYRDTAMARVVALSLLVVIADACAAQQPRIVRGPMFCEWSVGTTQPGSGPSYRKLQNDSHLALSALVPLAIDRVAIRSRSRDWKNDAEALARVREVLQSKPGSLSSMSEWAEGVSPDYKDVIATLNKERTAIIEIADYHVCVRDSEGRLWFFRTVPVDGWVK